MIKYNVNGLSELIMILERRKFATDENIRSMWSREETVAFPNKHKCCTFPLRFSIIGCCRDDVFLKANPEVSMALVLSTKSL